MSFHHRPSLESGPLAAIYSTSYPSTVFSSPDKDHVLPALGLVSCRPNPRIARLSTISTPSSIYTGFSSGTLVSDDSGYHTQPPVYQLKAPLPCRYSCVISDCLFATFSYPEFEAHFDRVHERAAQDTARESPSGNSPYENRASYYEPPHDHSSDESESNHIVSSGSRLRKNRLRNSVRKIKEILRQGSTKSSRASSDAHQSAPASPVSDDRTRRTTLELPSQKAFWFSPPVEKEPPPQELPAYLDPSELDGSACFLECDEDEDDATEACRRMPQDRVGDDYQGPKYTVHSAEPVFAESSIAKERNSDEPAHPASHEVHGEICQDSISSQPLSRSEVTHSVRNADDQDHVGQDGAMSRSSSFHGDTEFRGAIQDLLAKVDLLLQQTQPSRSPSFRSDELRASVMRGHDQHFSRSPEDPHTLIWPTEMLSVSRATSNASEAVRGRQIIGGKAPQDGSRSSSEPPRGRTPLSDWQAVILTRGSNSQSSSNYTSTTTPSHSGNGKSCEHSGNRPNNQDIGDGSGEGNGGGGNRSRKRQKVDIPDVNRERFPCIFAVAEPQVHRKAPHVKKHEHISQLLRHLGSHNFYACQYCFTKFPDKSSQDAHGENSCVKICTKRTCRRRYWPGETVPAVCQCITTSEEQWCELFHLQYPDQEIPDIFSDLDSPSVANVDDNADENALFDFDKYEAAVSSPRSPEDPRRSSDTHKRTFSTITASPLPREGGLRPPATLGDPGSGPNRPTSAPRERRLQAEVQTLRQKVSVLEQRLSRPTQREQVLEMVLKNVWQAFVRTGSPDAQADSAMWDLVKLMAPGILSAASKQFPEPAPSVAQTEMLGGSAPNPPDGRTGFGGDLFSSSFMFNSADVRGLESGYGSLRG